MAKAFHKVCYSKLLNKMFNLEICGNVLKWFSSYLTNRFQRTMVNDELSDYIHANSRCSSRLRYCTSSILNIYIYIYIYIYFNDLPSIF